MGVPGPDQGYVLKIVGRLRGEIRLTPGELLADAESVGVAVALKRASIFGRAPILADLRVAYTVWGMFDAQPPAELLAVRVARFEGMRHVAHHYPLLRALVNAVPAETLRLDPVSATEAYRRDWRSLLAL